MVLDPLSSFAIACNILQVIEVGTKVLSKAADYRGADNGVLSEQRDLRDVLQSLNSLNHDLQLSIQPQGISAKQTPEEIHLSGANNLCLRLSYELIALLDRLKLKDRHSVFDSLRLSIKTLWHSDKMDTMNKSLSQARDNLNIAFLVYMNSRQATRSSQDELLRTTTRVESSIVHAINSTSDSLQSEIKSLEEKLTGIDLDSTQEIVTQFAASHHDLLKLLSDRIDMILAMQTEFQASSDENESAAALQRILDSLRFPQFGERRDQIAKAFNETYEWFLEREKPATRNWDNFVSWLGDPSPIHRIYWVSGKIGAGKTTLLRFLEDNLSITKHMLPWAEKTTVVRASCFFWTSGNQLQKSISGLLRTLLVQLFEQTPNLISRVVHPKKWQTARLGVAHTIDWTDSELHDCLREYILHVTRRSKVFLLVDGLDEFDGTDEAREDLLDLLVTLPSSDRVKLCLSSRPWNIFRDALGSFPQVKLENLTQNDIRSYIQQRLYGNGRFQRLIGYDARAGAELVAKLVGKAAGVFLWVRLVMQELLKGLRDGDSYQVLLRKVDEVPADLDDYFMRLIDLIEPQYRTEASRFLQIALYQEEEFISLHSHSLLDFSFIEETDPSFAFQDFYDFHDLDFLGDALAFRLESTLRKLNSRCLGLLELGPSHRHSRLQELEGYVDKGDDLGSIADMYSSKIALGDVQFVDEAKVYATARSSVTFLHRSLRDFLLTSKTQDLLHRYTTGPFDARLFCQSARFAQLVALNKSEIDLDATVGLASYLLCTLTTSELRESSVAVTIATKLQPVIEDMTRFDFKQREELSGWYICPSLDSWEYECSSFLTLAIDFGLYPYVRLHLTPESIRTKEGRPILDYLLRPRFPRWHTNISVGNPLRDTSFIDAALSFGANPNQTYRRVSIWALFLCFIADRLSTEGSDGTFTQEASYLDVLKIMIQNGADVFLPRDWLSDPAYYESIEGDSFRDEEPHERLQQRFGELSPATPWETETHTVYALSDVLESFRGRLGSSVDLLIDLAIQRQVLYGIPSAGLTD
ncbi:hypothetical protein ACLMJK_003909 [Lecanora helva]